MRVFNDGGRKQENGNEVFTEKNCECDGLIC